MDFGSLPPEVNSARMYTGAGPATLLAASASWDSLAAELLTTVAGYQSVITGLTDESWIGPSSMSMETAVAPYLAWMTVTAAQCDQAATQATAAASAYEAAYAMTVPPPLVLTNRVQLATLVATNLFGQNTPAIMATEAEYSEMWAQDATAMYTYAANSAVASTFNSFASPPPTTNSSGLAAQVGTATQTTGTPSQAAAMSAVSQALQGLSAPASSSTLGGASGNTVGTAGALSSLSALVSSIGSSGDLNALFDVAGLGGDGAGLGTDFGGLGLDFGGTGMDVYGLSLDFEGAGSIIGAEGGVAGIPPVGGLGNLGSTGGIDGGAAAALGQAPALGTLSVPASWSDALSVGTPLPVLDANAMPGGSGAGPSISTGTVSKLPMGAMVGHGPGASAERIGFRSSVIPRSPAAG
ncbi:PPE family protein [Mycobacterium sp.]|uniref:PPE family protein n=1 Tax=Mycobacterium sp. TaxID=1785 RepID=UPI003C76DC35